MSYASLIALLQAFEPGLRAEFAEEYSSVHPEHRIAIRQSAATALGTPEELARGRVLDLSARPEFENWSVSISHCAHLGGWIALPRPARIGLDIEIRERIHPRLVDRISTADERATSPDGGYLWCAKEAYFKALAKDQPVTFSEVQVGNWRQGPEHTWFFSGQGPYGMDGLVTPYDDLLVAVAVSIRESATGQDVLP